jgi:hypothetical protein
MTRLDKVYIKQLVGSLNKNQIDVKDEKSKLIFDFINKNGDNNIDIEEITNFANALYAKDKEGNENSKIDKSEIKSFLQENPELSKENITKNDIKKFLEIFIKNSDKIDAFNQREDNEDGSYSIYVKDDNHYNNRPMELIQRDSDEKSFKVLELGFKKLNYNSDNQITSIEYTQDKTTTVEDKDGKITKTIVKNNGYQDTVTEYLSDTERLISYQDSDGNLTPKYKEVYNSDYTKSVYELNADGEIISRQDYDDCSRVTKIAKYVDGKETDSVNITNEYNLSDKVADGFIDNVYQHETGDCYLLNGLNAMSQTSWGRKAIKDCVKQNYPNEGDYTITFKRAYGETKEFTITKEELEKARDAKTRSVTWDTDKGDKIYVDGKLETISKGEDIEISIDNLKEGVTFVKKTGEKNIWTTDDIEEIATIYQSEIYSTGDLDTLAFELAVEKSRKEVNLPLDGGYRAEILTLLTTPENINIECFATENLPNNISPKIAYQQTKEKELEDDKKWESYLKLTDGYKYTETTVPTREMEEKIKNLKNLNLDNYMFDVSLSMDEAYHSASIKRIETIDDKDYVVYTHPWNMNAEVTEEVSEFAKKVDDLYIISSNNSVPDITNTDGSYGNYISSNKKNISNITSAINGIVNTQGENSINEMLSKNNDGSINVKFKGNKNPVVISAKDIATAKASGNYAQQDEDITALMIATERVLNERLYNNDLYSLEHTNLENLDTKDILELYKGGNCLKTQSRFSTAFTPSSYDNSIIMAEIDGKMLALKRVEKQPDGSYKYIFTANENSGFEVSYSSKEVNSMILSKYEFSD